MQLSGDLLIELRDAFLGAFSTTERLEELILLEKSVSLDQIQTPGANLSITITKIIVLAYNEHWLGSLLKRAQQLRPADPAFPELLRKLQTTIILENVDHYEVSWLDAGRALVNRKALRDALRNLDTPHGKRILIVDGDSFSGKSYSLRLIQYLAAEKKNFRVIPIDLEGLAKNQQNNEVPHDVLAQSLADRMKLADMPQIDREQAHWLSRFSQWFAGHVQNLELLHWIVLDGFHKTVLPLGTQDLIQMLAKEIDLNLPTLRLILLSYRDKDSLPPDVTPGIEYERITPIGEQDLISFFTTLYETRKRRQHKEYEFSEVARSVASVLQQVDPQHPRRLEFLSAAVVREAQAQALR